MKHITVYDKYNEILTSGNFDVSSYALNDNRVVFQYDNGQVVVVFNHMISKIVVEDIDANTDGN